MYQCYRNKGNPQHILVDQEAIRCPLSDMPTKLSFAKSRVLCTRRFLTHCGRYKMAAIFHMISSNAISWMKMYKFLRLDKRLSKQSWHRWFETHLRWSWRHCNENYRNIFIYHHVPISRCLHSLADVTPLQWRHNGRYSVSNHQPHDCLLNRLFRRRSKKTSKLRVTGLCAGKSPVTSELPAQMASNAENLPFDDVMMT